ncbi:MAG TPA: hypothetical protein VIC26_01905 [Marinagarivorans sp.]
MQRFTPDAADETTAMFAQISVDASEKPALSPIIWGLGATWNRSPQ